MHSGPQADAQLRALIYAEQIGMLYRQLPTSTAGNMAGALVLAGSAITEHTLSSWSIGAWVACMAALQAWRLMLYVRCRRNGFALPDARRAAMIWTSGVVVSGILWGSTALLFFTPENPVFQAVLTVLVFGITASAIPLIGSYIPSFYVFVFPALTPFIARNALLHDVPHFVISVTEAVVMLGFASFARNYNRMLIESLRNRYEKQALADRLAHQNVDLEQARVAAERANRSKTQFFAAASHDLRQPLHALGLFAGALTEKARDPEVSGVVSSINASVHALDELFNELLDISKIDSGVIKPGVTSFALSGIFERLRAGFAAEAAEKNLRLTMAGGDCVVDSDAVLLERILRNLVSNAVRYTPAGEVAITATPGSHGVRIEVRDTGIGIRTEDQQRIFEEFVQLGNPARTSKKGLGLGLAIVQRLCSLLGTTIHLESAAGGGSAFSFTLAPGQQQAAPSHAASAPEAARANLAGKLVVVIDDESAIVEGMRVLLAGWGADVLGSATGDDVVSAVHADGRVPALMIVDHRLGNGANGIAVAQRIRRELDPEIPVLLITGSITPALCDEARAAGLGFLLKPVTADKLRDHLGSVLAPPAPAR